MSNRTQDPEENGANSRWFSTATTVMLLTLPGAALCSIPFGLFIQKEYLSWQPVSPHLALVGAAVLVPVSAISSWIAWHTQSASRDGRSISRWLLAFNIFISIATAGVLFLILMTIIFCPS